VKNYVNGNVELDLRVGILDGGEWCRRWRRQSGDSWLRGGVVTALVAGVGVGDEDDQGVAMRTWGAGPTTTRAGVGRTSAQWDGQ
jgi:hypothetical protein